MTVKTLETFHEVPTNRAPDTAVAYFDTRFSRVSGENVLVDANVSESPNSFSMTANFMPWVWSFRMWLRSVVLPLPKNPVRTVTGIVLPFMINVLYSDLTVWALCLVFFYEMIEGVKKEQFDQKDERRKRPIPSNLDAHCGP